MLGNLTPTERRVLCAALRVQLASKEGMALYCRNRGLPIHYEDKERARDIKTLKNLLSQLG